MFGVLFGWRKASKCKKVIKEAQCRLKLLKNKRNSIVKHLREDTANLIKFGHEDIALNRAEQLIKDESVAVAYELIDNFCDFIRTHFSYIRRHKDCPDDINEAVSSLIYASTRCADLPELRVMRELFVDRYGQNLADSAVDLFPGNLVSRQIKEALNIKFVTDEMKLRMVNEIATDYCLQRLPLALEYYPEWQQEVKESNDQGIQASLEERSEIRISNSAPEGKVVLFDSSPSRPISLARKCRGTIVKASFSSSSESLPIFPEETLLVHLDDVVEFPNSPKDDGDSNDTRIFKFKSPTLSKRVSFDQRYDGDSPNENSSPNSGSQRSRSVTRKRSRRRLVYAENPESTSYYAQPHKPRYSLPRKQEKKIRLVEDNEIEVTPSASNPRRSCSKRIDFESLNAESGGEVNWVSMPRKPYSRAETMPVERPSKKNVAKDEFQRSNSCPVQEHPIHVHPKLPDYDELTATFLALKKEFLMNNNNQC